MIAAAGVTVLVLMVVGAALTFRTRNRTVRMVYVVPLWILGGCGVIVAGTVLWYGVQLRDYDACVARADRSAGSRAQTIQLYDTIDALTARPEYTQSPILPNLPSLRDALDINLPVLDASRCEHP